MPTPTERLEIKRQTLQCKVCAWMGELDEKTRKGWVIAISNPRYSNNLIANEINVDGGEISEGSVQNHRAKGHR